MEVDLESVARKWLKHHYRITENVEVLIRHTQWGTVVNFYNSETWEDLPMMITVPVVERLLAGQSYRQTLKQDTRV